MKYLLILLLLTQSVLSQEKIYNIQGVGKVSIENKNFYLPKKFVILKDEDVIYYENGKIHRDDGPAIIGPDKEIWYKNGMIHRNHAPAVIYSDGSKYWHQNGKLHKDIGPAVIIPNGKKEYWKNGKQLFK